jgi:hypothetical protein
MLECGYFIPFSGVAGITELVGQSKFFQFMGQNLQKIILKRGSL